MRRELTSEEEALIEALDEAENSEEDPDEDPMEDEEEDPEEDPEEEEEDPIEEMEEDPEEDPDEDPEEDPEEEMEEDPEEDPEEDFEGESNIEDSTIGVIAEIHEIEDPNLEGESQLEEIVEIDEHESEEEERKKRLEFTWNNVDEDSSFDIDDFHEKFGPEGAYSEYTYENQRSRAEQLKQEFMKTKETSSSKYSSHLSNSYFNNSFGCMKQDFKDDKQKAKGKKPQLQQDHTWNNTQDKGSFSVPCIINTMKFPNALCDLGASINLMPYSFYRDLGLTTMAHTRMELSLADHTVIRPLGVVEGLRIHIGQFAYTTDFVVINTDNESPPSLILGRPFLSQSKTEIDVYNGKLTLSDERGLYKQTFYMYGEPPDDELRKEAMNTRKRTTSSQPRSKVKRKKEGTSQDSNPLPTIMETMKEAMKSDEVYTYRELLMLSKLQEFEDELKRLGKQPNTDVHLKYEDQGSFTIPCTIGGVTFKKSLCDTGAALNVMPLSCFTKLGKSEQVKLEDYPYDVKLANNNYIRPLGVLKNVMVVVDQLQFPADFVVFNGERTTKDNLILGRPFLVTSQAQMDMFEGVMVLNKGKEHMVTRMYEPIKKRMLNYLLYEGLSDDFGRPP